MTTPLSQMAALNARVWDFLSRLTGDEINALSTGDLQLTLSGASRPEETTGRQSESSLIAAHPEPTEVSAPVRGPRAKSRTGSVPPSKLKQIADTLRSKPSLDEGADLLASLGLLKADLLALGEELGVRIPASKRRDEILKLVLNQAIGARRKFAGLSKW